MATSRPAWTRPGGSQKGQIASCLAQKPIPAAGFSPHLSPFRVVAATTRRAGRSEPPRLPVTPRKSALPSPGRGSIGKSGHRRPNRVSAPAKWCFPIGNAAPRFDSPSPPPPRAGNDTSTCPALPLGCPATSPAWASSGPCPRCIPLGRSSRPPSVSVSNPAVVRLPNHRSSQLSGSRSLSVSGSSGAVAPAPIAGSRVGRAARAQFKDDESLRVRGARRLELRQAASSPAHRRRCRGKSGIRPAA